MLKCGQKDNLKYTFGLRKDQMLVDTISEEEKIIESGNKEYLIRCSHCGQLLKISYNYCSSCGTRVE